MEKQTIQLINTLVNEISLNKSYPIIVNNRQEGSGNFFAKSSGVVSGVDVVEQIYKTINPNIKVNIIKNNGEYVNRGDVILAVKGRLIDILKGQQLSVEFLQQLSGVATIVDKYSSEIKDLPCKILANSKGIPFNTELYNNAFKDGGGIPRDNYLRIDEYLKLISEDIEEAIHLIRKKFPTELLEIIVGSKEEFEKILEMGINRVILNSTNNNIINECLLMKNNDFDFAISGNFSIGNIRSLATKGVDYIIIDNISSLAKGLEVAFKLYKRPLM